MNPRSFHAMGTWWWLHCDEPELLPEAERVVRNAEARLSRFRSDSALSHLNRERVSSDALVCEVVRAALRLREITAGIFDPTLGSQLRALGYDRSFAHMGVPGPTHGITAPRPEVVCEGDEVRLVGEGELDLGGIAKGFTVDRVVAWLEKRGAHEILVDGGGDIRGAGGSFAIGVGDGLVVDSVHGAIATSSTRERSWSDSAGEELHHVLDPRTDRPAASSIDSATVIAGDAATADALATALLVDPEPMLATVAALGLHALARDHDGSWWMTAGAPARGARGGEATRHAEVNR